MSFSIMQFGVGLEILFLETASPETRPRGGEVFGGRLIA